jgi:hypothetical protein
MKWDQNKWTILFEYCSVVRGYRAHKCRMWEDRAKVVPEPSTVPGATHYTVQGMVTWCAVVAGTAQWAIAPTTTVCNGAGKMKERCPDAVWINSEAYGSAWQLRDLGLSNNTYRPCTKGQKKTTELSTGPARLSTPDDFAALPQDPDNPEDPDDSESGRGNAESLRRWCGLTMERCACTSLHSS